MKRPSVVHVVEDLGIGGMERAVQAFARISGARVVCTRAGGPVADELRAQGVRVDVLEAGGTVSLSRALSGDGPVVVHSHGAAGSLARRAARLAGASAVVHHLHGTEKLGLKQKLLERALPADLYLACSEFVREDFARQTSAARVEVLHNPVDTERFRFSAEARRICRKELGASERTLVVMTVGRFASDKGQRFLLLAAPLILASREALFVFVGEGAQKQACVKLASRLQAPSRFVPAQRDVAPLLSACDVYAQPSVNREGLGLAVLEAMACERPVVASRLQGLSETVGEAGELVRPADPAALAEAILRAKGGAKGRARVEESFSVESVEPRLRELYRRALGER